jgi:hypothetical protein
VYTDDLIKQLWQSVKCIYSLSRFYENFPAPLGITLASYKYQSVTANVSQFRRGTYATEAGVTCMKLLYTQTYSLHEQYPEMVWGYAGSNRTCAAVHGGELVRRSQMKITAVIDVISFLCVSLGSSTVKLQDSVGSRRACACSDAVSVVKMSTVPEECTI